MSLQTINIGTAPNDMTGDTVRVGGQKINANFKYLDEKSAAYAVGEIYSGPVLRIYNEDLYVLKSTITFPYTTTNFDTELAAGNWSLVSEAVDLSQKADLVAGKVPASQLPSYVDDVLEFANLATLPTTGEAGKIYITIDTNKQYRWGGTGYIEISASTAVWGSISGGITNQTDLMYMLSLKQNTISATTNRLLRYTPGGIVSSIIHDDGTNVGIGTTSPASKLHIEGTTTGDVLFLKSNKPGIGGAILGCNDSDNNTLFRVYGNVLSSNYAVSLGDASFNGLPFLQVNSSSAFFGDTNVGIGTNSPSEKLTVSDGKLFLTALDPTIGGKIYGYNDTSVNLYSGGLKFQTRYFNGSNYVYVDRLTINSSGNVGIGTSSPDASAILDLTSTSKGFLPPRMQQSERDSIASPVSGLMIFNTDTEKVDVFTSDGWKQITLL